MSEYLAIKNWEKRQPGRKGKSEWIKDYTDKDTDDKYEKLTVFQRYVLDAIRRLRGRLGKNIPSDPMYVARATHMLPRDRTHVAQAIHRLCTDKFLFLTNQEVDFLDKEKEIDKEEEKTKPSAAPKQTSKPKPDNTIFDKAYSQYPRHIGKRAAEKAWSAALARSAEPPIELAELIYQRVMTFSAVCERSHKPREYIPHMATWLNQDRFLDDPTEWAVSNGNGSTYVNKGQQRQDASNDAIRTALNRITGQGASESEGSLPLLGHDGGNSGDLLAGDGSVGGGSRKTQIFGSDYELPARVQDVSVHRGDAQQSSSRDRKATHGAG